MKKFPVAILATFSLVLAPGVLSAQTSSVIDPTSLKFSDTPVIAQITASPEPALLRPVPTSIQQPSAPPSVIPVPATTSAPAPSAPTPEDIQGFVESVTDVAPSAVQPYLKMLASAIGGALVLFGIQKAVQGLKRKGSEPCSICQGTGREHASGTCSTCKGTRQVEEEYEPKMDCVHCGGEGKEPCESCEGKGCAACKETGREHNEENKMIDCKVCKGEGELSVKVKRNVACPDCKS